ncbi:hypothetical protein FOMPIDRAFT_1166520 [Fomitopsis schrenkii]|uniref:L-aminoadipate-semialdehyde dehydrogenase n=1 Tax=Fomitopsis schrenkii TaxID=2126942 RepID=S8FG71_FOMSC|nr:hypothetical protein FOMPIDRAFT_1166520 [Fomitopsis schrenkii]
MADARTARTLARLQNLPSISLPTDYPRLAGNRLVEAAYSAELSEATCKGLLKLALYNENDDTEEEEAAEVRAPSPFHILLAAFTVLLHRYTGDTDLVIGSSSASARDPLVLRISVNPDDLFWAVVRKVQQVEQEAEADVLPYEAIIRALGRDKSDVAESSRPLFRVRFFDETDTPQEHFLRSTSLTSDLTVFVTRQHETTRSSVAPHIGLRLLYNSLLFTPARMTCIVDQLSILLRKVAANPVAPVGSVPLLTPAQRAILPDPTANLNWCDWKGAITDVFSRNARRWPDRPCVIQCLPSPSFDQPQEKRTFSYRMIHHASNILAHHLLRGGVQREEVVMVYAYRSVELVVAVMAVLKAGATFSVIDPAYPPSRQTIYLKVAQPRALVVLKGAGRISPSVREFISSELQIRVEVPALELLADGQLVGGQSPDGKDVLDAQLSLGDQDPDVPLGPDSVGTLSFTSGSTGIPKGVRGRHYSLTHFFPWMGERFGLGEDSKFTMLSGIAHDPIQRDMFTPLFFGARLYVPTADDIGTPGRLAEWMADNEVTVTHLTPAMGQLLSAQATRQIPSLRNAFFVGDILTKRDCLRLQSLATNVRIVNMYGTTETQRAVSYFLLPSVSEDPTFLATQKDVMPAGEGMIDVQLLVVNRNDRNVPCAVGEVGEIYVRSGGLAEGYSDADATAEKFVTNWRLSETPPPQRKPPDVIGVALTYNVTSRSSVLRSLPRTYYARNGVPRGLQRSREPTRLAAALAGREAALARGRVEHIRLLGHPLQRDGDVDDVRADPDREVELLARQHERRALPAGHSARVRHAEGRDESESAEKDLRAKLRAAVACFYFRPRDMIPIGHRKLSMISLATSPSRCRARLHPHFLFSLVPRSPPTALALVRLYLRPTSSTPPSPRRMNTFDLTDNFDGVGEALCQMRTITARYSPGDQADEPIVGALLSLGEASYDRFCCLGGRARLDSAIMSWEKALSRLAPGHQDRGATLNKLAVALHTRFKHFGDGADLEIAMTLHPTLGAFILRDLLSRPERVKKVIALVRASDADKALERLRDAASGRGVWDEEWVKQSRLEVAKGDLDQEHFGLEEQAWNRIASETDAIVHNGALVHWVYPYERLRPANVLGTLTALDLAATGRPKLFVFVSSTSAIDTEYYVQLSDSLSHGGENSLGGVPESEDLEGARTSLKTGYGQSKWVSEKLLFEAGRRGLKGHIVRPGYVVGDSESAVTNTDDFIWRMVKGCIQLGLVPDINNTVNMVPVDHVARCTTLAALAPLPAPHDALSVLHVAAYPRPTFNDFLSSLARHGFATERCEYLLWRRQLEKHVMEVQDNALFPLLHFVLDDLPTSTKAPELNDANMRALLAPHMAQTSRTVDDELMGKYLSWLVDAGFLPPPSNATAEKALPRLTSRATRAVGRSGV